MPLKAVEDLVRGFSRIPFTRGNRLELLVDGEATYAAMLKADLERCEPVDRAHFDEKAFRFRVAARIARLASPLL